MKQNLLRGGLAILVIAAVGYIIWWNTPQQKAIRFLSKLSEVASVLELDNALARRRRVPKLLKLLSDPVSVEIRAASIQRQASHDQVATAYLGVVSNSRQLLVNFTDIEVISASSTNIVAAAQLATACDFQDGQYTVQAPVEVNIELGDEGPRLSVITETSEVQ